MKTEPSMEVKIQSVLREILDERSAGEGDGLLVCTSPPGHLLEQRISQALLRLPGLTSETDASTSPASDRVFVVFSDPLHDLPFERFAPYQVREIVACWSPSSDFKHPGEFTRAIADLRARLQPMAIVVAIEGEGFDQVISVLPNRRWAWPTSPKEVVESLRVEASLRPGEQAMLAALTEESLQGTPASVYATLMAARALLQDIPPAEHPAYQQRLARLPELLSDLLAPLVLRETAEKIAMRVHEDVASVNTDLRTRLRRRNRKRGAQG